MVESCPHCHMRVLRKTDGTCPSCGNLMSDLRGADLEIARVEIDDIHLLPPVCAYCGAGTDRRVRLRLTRAPPGTGDRALASLAVFLVFGWLPWLFWKAFGVGKEKMEFEIPQCRDCACAKGKPSLEHVDFEDRRASLLVHVEFDRVLRHEREARRSAPATRVQR